MNDSSMIGLEVISWMYYLIGYADSFMTFVPRLRPDENSGGQAKRFKQEVSEKDTLYAQEKKDREMLLSFQRKIL